MEEEIHFLVNELEGELHNKVKNILKDLENPVRKKDNIIVKKFARALVQETARRMYHPQPVRQRQQTDTAFAALRSLEQYHMRMQQQEVQQPRYYSPIIEKLPQTGRAQHELAPTVPPRARETPSDIFLPSGLPPKPPEATPLSRLPTDETLTSMPESFSQYRLPLSSEVQKAAANPQYALPPSPTLPTPIAITVPSGVEPPIALIIDAESKKPIVTVAMQNEIYTVTEPGLTPEEMNMITWLRKKFSGKEKKLANKKKLMKKINKAAKKMHASIQKNDENEYLKMKYYLVKHLVRFGWVEPLLHDEEITKIVCDGENTPLTIVRKNKTWKTNISYLSADHINKCLMKFAESAYKKISEKNPVLDFIANGYHVEGSLKTKTTPAKFTLTRVA